MTGIYGKAALIVAALAVCLLLVYRFALRNDHSSWSEGLAETKLTIDDSVGERTLSGLLWQDPLLTDYKGLILVSHGFSANAYSLVRYATRLAKDGYVVAALSHDDLASLRSGKILNDPMLTRPRDLHLLLQYVRQRTEIPGIQSLPVGLLGYSLGGYGALTAAGVATQFSQQASYCESLKAAADPIMCSPRFTTRIGALLEQDLNPATDSSSDFSAMALFAPGYTPLLDLDADTHLPKVLLINGEQDEFISPLLMDSLASHNDVIEHQTIPDAGHYVYLTSCAWPLTLFAESCRDPVSINRNDIQVQIEQSLVSFFNRTL